ncbi:hypothetical protein NKH77_03615 [Streptomyces sp. M19]
MRVLTHCRAQALRVGDDAAYAYATHRLAAPRCCGTTTAWPRRTSGPR